jgi:hypothetical protein
MLSERDLFDSITIAALKGCDADVGAHSKTVWNAAVCLLADVLRQTDPFTRERLLRGLVAELREDIAELDRLLQPKPYPRTPEQVQ